MTETIGTMFAAYAGLCVVGGLALGCGAAIFFMCWLFDHVLDRVVRTVFVMKVLVEYAFHRKEFRRWREQQKCD